MLKKILPLIVAVFLNYTAQAQSPSLGFRLGGTADDAGHVTKIAPNGNIMVTGRFSGTMDLDPGAGTYNITAVGSSDIFLACYNPAGAFQWGFGIGGANYDEATEMAIDLNNDVVIGGAFMASGIDFNPGAGTAILPFVGGTGPAGGDGFVAKYSSTGAFQWAYDLGASTRYDFVTGVATDEQKNVYVCGYFTGTMAASTSVSWNSVTTGKGFVIKYTPGGSYIWGIVFGWPGYAADDSYPFSIQVHAGKVYTCGLLEGSSNFDPAGSAAGALSPAGRYDGYLALYDTSGNFIYTRAISGAGYVEAAVNLSLDTFDNMYITGLTSSANVTFDLAAASSSTVACPGGGGNNDIFISKYTTTGAYVWGRVVGASGNEDPRDIDVHQGNVFITGSFPGTVDFDPSGAVSNLVSNGGNDIYVGKYDTAGNYLCGYDVGSAGDDLGWGITHDAAGNIYTTGHFSGTATDFDPGSGTYPLTSAGGLDAYLVKYSYTSSSPMVGTLTGDTICAGQPAYLTLNITSGGTGPFNVTVNTGSGSYTYTGVVNAVPFLVTPAPASTTTYTITAITFAGVSVCTGTSVTGVTTATIVVQPISATISTTTVSCNTIAFSGAVGDTSYVWSFGDGTTSTMNPITHTYTAAGTYTVTLNVVNSARCTAADTITVTINPPVRVDLGPDTSLCTGTPYTLSSSVTYGSGATYLWSTGATASSIVAGSSGTYWLRVTEYGCTSADTVVVNIIYDSLHLITNDTAICKGKSLQVLCNINPAATCQWLPTAGIAVSNVPNAFITPDTSAMYKIIVYMTGCPPISDSFFLDVQPVPDVYLGGNRFVCEFDTIHIHADAKPHWYRRYSYNWAPATYLDFSNRADAVFSAGSTTKYIVTVTTPAGCAGKDSAIMIVNPGNFANISPDTSICPHDSVQLHVNGGVSYQWSPALYLSDAMSADPWLHPVAAQSFSVIATSAAGCKDTVFFKVHVFPAALISMDDSVTIYPGESYHIQPFTNCNTFLWTPPAGLSSTVISDPVAQPEVDTRYILRGVTVDGCIAIDSIDILVSPETELTVPNAFTPGNGVNSKFSIIKRGQATLNYFRVLNRWGNLVFETTNINDGWDGNYKGEPQMLDVYVYDIQAVTHTGKLFSKHGNVTLLR